MTLQTFAAFALVWELETICNVLLNKQVVRQQILHLGTTQLFTAEEGDQRSNLACTTSAAELEVTVCCFKLGHWSVLCPFEHLIF
jgi:hypothetical protein